MSRRSLVAVLSSLLALGVLAGPADAGRAKARATATATQAAPRTAEPTARPAKVRGKVGRPARKPTKVAAPRSPARLKAYARQLFAGGATPAKIRTLHELAGGFTDEHGRATAELADALQAIDRAHGDGFDRKTTRRFQQLLGELGVKTHRPLDVPLARKPYWLMGKQPLANFQSKATLPERADVVIVGAGLTGASAAYHMAEQARARGLKVVVIDGGDPANQASGRNGGNFEIMPENFMGVYEGIQQERLKYLAAVYPEVDRATLEAEADRQARAVLRFTSKNRARFVDILQKEKLDVDFSPRGWLRIAETDVEERGIHAEVALGRELGLDIKTLTPAEIKARTGIDTKYGGRLTQDGNYHPFKYVSGLLEKSLERGVELYTRTPVETITSGEGGTHLVKTARGTIQAKNVIMATNAFTREVLPELAGIEPYQSQIMVTQHAPVTYPGLITMRQGDLYAHYREDENRYPDPALAKATGGKVTQRAPLLQGGGLDRPFKDPHKPRVSTKVFRTMVADRARIAPDLTGQPPSRTWTGPMAFTRDRLPAVGYLRPGLIIAAGFNGYGGSYTTAAGEAVAKMALDGEVPEWVPQDVFTPTRLLTHEPPFEAGKAKAAKATTP